MIHPTRTDLLQLRERAVAVVDSVAILIAEGFRALRARNDAVTEALCLILVLCANEVARSRALACRPPSLEEILERRAILPRANLALAALSLRELGTDG